MRTFACFSTLLVVMVTIHLQGAWAGGDSSQDEPTVCRLTLTTGQSCTDPCPAPTSCVQQTSVPAALQQKLTQLNAVPNSLYLCLGQTCITDTNCPSSTTRCNTDLGRCEPSQEMKGTCHRLLKQASRSSEED